LVIEKKLLLAVGETQHMDLFRLQEFRLYYNTHIHPELMRTERLRRRLLLLLFISLLLGLAIMGVLMYLNMAGFTLLLLMPLVFYMLYLGWRIQEFRRTFKPRVMRLVLDFMQQGVNYDQLSYDAKRSIAKSRFQQSGLFKTSAPYYLGEDYITGLVGMMPFELSELSVRELSPLTNKLQEVFEGIFVYAIFGEDAEGSIRVWPRRHKKYLTRSIKEFAFSGGSNQDEEMMNPEFRELFLVYATEDTHVAGILSEPMQAALVQFVHRTDKDVYISFHNREIYAGVTSERDLLEPFVFRSNLSFELIYTFYRDISLALKIIEDFDQTH
jgi:hypothetical protein